MAEHEHHSELESIINSMDIMWAFVGIDICFQYMSDSFAEWIGIDPKEAIGESVADILGKDAEEKLGGYWQQALEGQSVRFNDHVSFLGHGPRFLDIAYLPHSKQGKVTGYYVCFQDNTEQNRTIETLTKIHGFTTSSLNLTDKINGLLKLGCEVFDLPLAIVSRIKDDKYTVKYSCTPNDEISPGDVFETPGTYCIHTLNANGPVAFNNAGNSDIKTHPCYLNFGLESYIGTPLVVDGNRYGTLSFSGPEITNRTFTLSDFSLIQLLSQWISNEFSRYFVEKNLNRQQQLLESMSEQARIGAWEVDLIKNTIYWSSMTSTIHEVDDSYTPNLDTALLFYKKGYSRDRITELFECAVETGEGWKEELQIITHKGNEVWVAAIGNVELNEGKAVRLFGSFQDIDSRVKSELELKMAKAEAELAVRSKSAFLANMSHEIRTPMNGVIGMLNILKKSALTEEQLHYVNLASTSGESLLTIINDILDFSKVEAGKFDLERIDFDLPLMLGDLAEAMAFRAQEKGLELILDFSALTSNFVKGDPARLNQIITNLIGNAIKFTQKGEIILRASNRESLENTSVIDFSIADSGIGIDSHKQMSLFEKFTQADNSTTRLYGGTGLGLSIAKQLCELMGGEISVSSQIGVGSTFSFSVELNNSDKNTGLKPELDFTGYNVVLISDTKALRDISCNEIKQWHAEKVTSFSYVDIIGSYKNHEESIDFILIDVPISQDINEVDIDLLIDWGQSKNSVIIMLGAIEKCELLSHNYSKKVHAIIPKPVTPNEMIRIVNMIRENPEELSNVSSLPDSISDSKLLEIEERAQAKKRLSKILLVEDNLINQIVAEELLAEIGYSIDIANNGKEALDQLLNNQVDAYDLILMDCQMPEMDGYQASEQIRMGFVGDNYLNIPIIALTANAMKGDKQKCLDAGMNDYLSKPIDPEKLDAKITHYLQDKLT